MFISGERIIEGNRHGDKTSGRLAPSTRISSFHEVNFDTAVCCSQRKEEISRHSRRKLSIQMPIRCLLSSLRYQRGVIPQIVPVSRAGNVFRRAVV